ncbi:MAG: class I SAM-dependent methyltransferase [Flavobacteriales bacterium]|nr:class I SAM-dependent methyltransferase [Flavobacteriales bacterium]
MSREAEVQTFFEQPEIYLHFDYNLKIRGENVIDFIGEEQFQNASDMPCGNGVISTLIVDQSEALTCIDFSSKMVELTRENIASEKHSKVVFINDDFYNQNFEKGAYDLVVCLGILAHIKDPQHYVKEVGKLVKPGGKFILQNTNHNHFYAKLIRIYLGARKMVGKDKYTLNKVKSSSILEAIGDEFKVLKKFNYNQSFLGFSRLFSNEKKYKMTRNWFGTVASPKKQSWGCDNTWLFEKKA